MSAAIDQNWRRRMADLARGAGKPHAPLFAPILHSVASQIESLPVAEFVMDATKLGKGLSELRRALGLGAITVAVPSAMEAEALGAEVDLGSWPPPLVSSPGASALQIDDHAAQYANSPRLQASLEATKRLASTEATQPALIAVLTGPAMLLRQLAPDAKPEELEALYDAAGRALATLVRLYAEAGINVLVLQEDSVKQDGVEAWQGALNPIANVARFHKLPPLLMFTGAAASADAWPASLIPCPAYADSQAFGGQPHAIAVATSIDAWSGLPDGADNTRLILTMGEVSPAISIAELLEQRAA